MALFDFDGTLSPGDSIVAYLRFCVRERIAPRTQWLRAGAGFAGQRLGLIPVSRAKAMTLSFIRGRSRAEMDDLARRFLREQVLPHCYAEGLREISRARAAGLRVAVISASPEVYMRVLTEFLPIDEVLSTPCALDSSGRYTGAVGPNCRGVEKIARIRAAWPAGTGIAEAFGDSAHDLPMLRLAERPVLVNPKRGVADSIRAETMTWQEETGSCW